MLWLDLLKPCKMKLVLLHNEVDSKIQNKAKTITESLISI